MYKKSKWNTKKWNWNKFQLVKGLKNIKRMSIKFYVKIKWNLIMKDKIE